MILEHSRRFAGSDLTFYMESKKAIRPAYDAAERGFLYANIVPIIALSYFASKNAKLFRQ